MLTHCSSVLSSVLRRCWLGGRKGIRHVKKLDWWGAGVVICLERDADLHMAQLMPLPLAVSCVSKIQIGFTCLVPAHPGSPGQTAVKGVCVCSSGMLNTLRDQTECTIQQSVNTAVDRAVTGAI